MARPTTDISRWARMGAEARLKEIETELASIYRAFPDLKRGRAAVGRTPRVAGDGTQKRHFSAAGKKAISQGMREYWARRKALAAKAAKAASK